MLVLSGFFRLRHPLLFSFEGVKVIVITQIRNNNSEKLGSGYFFQIAACGLFQGGQLNFQKHLIRIFFFIFLTPKFAMR